MKAVLVIDIPYGIFIEDCVINYKVQESVMQKNVSAGVERLKPLPSKLVPFGYLDAGNEDGLYEKGYNDCIDEITGKIE